MLKPSEAAVVARVALRDVNRVIDENILPEGFFSTDDGRRVAAAACTLIAFYFDTAKRLTSEECLFAIREAGSRLYRFRARTLASLIEEDWTVRDEFLTIDLAPFVRRTKERMERLAAAREIVISDPDVLGGAPVVRGTRVPVHDVVASVAAGHPDGRHPRGLSRPSTRTRSSLLRSTPRQTLRGGARRRATSFPKARSSSPTDGFLAAGRRDEVF